MIDLSRFYSGPHATQLLAGLGAEVIRIDDPAAPMGQAKAPPHAGAAGVAMAEQTPDDLSIHYLKRNRGIPDREVALELRKLLSGSAARTKFRLVVVDHPDHPPSGVGRPPAKIKEPSTRDLDLVAVYRAQFATIGKLELAREEAARVSKVSVSTMKRAIRRVEAAEAEAEKWRELLERRQAALENLSRSTTGHETS